MDDIKIEISFEGMLEGLKMTRDDKVIQWNDLSYDEQVRMLNCLARFFNMFKRFLKK